MVLNESFPVSMGWKEGSGCDNRPDIDMSPLDTKHLDLISPMLLAFVKSRE